MSSENLSQTFATEISRQKVMVRQLLYLQQLAIGYAAGEGTPRAIACCNIIGCVRAAHSDRVYDLGGQ